MKYIFLIFIALLCLETNPMEPVAEESDLKRAQTWQDLNNLTEPLLSELDKCKLTDSEYDFVFSKLPKSLTQNDLEDISVLHTLHPEPTIPTLKLPTPTGIISINAWKTSVLELPEAQEDPLKFIHENPISAKVKGKITLEHTSYFAAHSLLIYTDFEISSINLDPQDTLLTISGKNKNKYRMLIYLLTKDLRLLKLKSLEAQTEQSLEMQSDSFFYSYRSIDQVQSPSKFMSLLQRLGVSKPAAERK